MDPSNSYQSSDMQSSAGQRRTLTKVFSGHLPVVQEASFRLQEMMGMPLGDRVQEHLAAAPWEMPTPDQIKDVPVQATWKAPVAMMGPPPRPLPQASHAARQRLSIYRDAPGTFSTGGLAQNMHRRRLGLEQTVPMAAQVPTIASNMTNSFPTPQARKPLSVKDWNASLLNRVGHGLAKQNNESHLPSVLRGQPQLTQHFLSGNKPGLVKRKITDLSVDEGDEEQVAKASKVVVIDLTSPKIAPNQPSLPASFSGGRRNTAPPGAPLPENISSIRAQAVHRTFPAPKANALTNAILTNDCDGPDDLPDYEDHPSPSLSNLYSPHDLANAGLLLNNMNYLMSSSLAFCPDHRSLLEKPPAPLQDIANRRKQSMYDPTANMPTNIPLDMTHRDISPIPSFERVQPGVPVSSVEYSPPAEVRTKREQGYSPSHSDASTRTPGCPASSDQSWCSGCGEERSCDKCDTDNISSGGSLFNDYEDEQDFRDDEDEFHDEEEEDDEIDEFVYDKEVRGDVDGILDQEDPLGDFYNAKYNNGCVPRRPKTKKEADHADDDSFGEDNPSSSESSPEEQQPFAFGDSSDSVSSRGEFIFEDDPAYADFPSEEPDTDYDTDDEKPRDEEEEVEEEDEEQEDEENSSPEASPPQDSPRHKPPTNEPIFFVPSLSKTLSAHLANRNTLVSSTHLIKCSFFRAPNPSDASFLSSAEVEVESPAPTYKHIITVAAEHVSCLRVIRLVLPELCGAKVMTEEGALVDRLPREWLVLEIVDRVSASSFSPSCSSSSSDDDVDGGDSDYVDDAVKEYEAGEEEEQCDSDAENKPPLRHHHHHHHSTFASSPTSSPTAQRKEGNEDENKDHRLPYYILAFPTQSITATATNPTPAPASSSPLNEGGEEEGRFRTTTTTSVLTFGKKGRLPLVHTRGHEAGFLKEWVEACGRGEGVLGFEFGDGGIGGA